MGGGDFLCLRVAELFLSGSLRRKFESDSSCDEAASEECDEGKQEGTHQRLESDTSLGFSTFVFTVNLRTAQSISFVNTFLLAITLKCKRNASMQKTVVEIWLLFLNALHRVYLQAVYNAFRRCNLVV